MDEDIKLPEPVAYMGTFQIAGCKPGKLAHHTHTNLEALRVSGPRGQSVQPLFTADQLRSAVEVDRARRVVLSDDHIEDLCMELFVTAQGNSPMSEKLARIDAIVRRYLSEQPARQPLTDEQAASLAKQLGWDTMPERFPLIVRAVEQAHGIGVNQ